MPVGLGAPTGLCGSCRYAHLNETRRGPVYLRCTRASWDERLVKYPPLPVLSCVGFDQASAATSDDE
jgi:propionyl-CoA synthetase